MAVSYKGGRCVVCGYNKCLQALEFHHLDKEDKSFPISTCNTKSWLKIKEELDKCILLCACCHRELECGMLKVSDTTVNRAQVGSIPTPAAWENNKTQMEKLMEIKTTKTVTE